MTRHPLTAERLARICERHALERKHLVVLAVFLRGHPDVSFVRGLWDLVHGRGPAAVACGVDLRATP